MKIIKVIGLYSPFGDDQCGYYAIEALKESIGDQEGVSIEALDRPGITLIEAIKGYDIVILIDAVISNKECGYITRLENANISSITQKLSSHQVGLIETIKIAESLNMLPKKLIFYGIEVKHIQYNQSFSDNVRKGISELVIILKNEITEILKYGDANAIHH